MVSGVLEVASAGECQVMGERHFNSRKAQALTGAVVGGSTLAVGALSTLAFEGASLAALLSIENAFWLFMACTSAGLPDAASGLNFYSLPGLQAQCVSLRARPANAHSLCTPLAYEAMGASPAPHVDTLHYSSGLPIEHVFCVLRAAIGGCQGCHATSRWYMRLFACPCPTRFPRDAGEPKRPCGVQDWQRNWRRM